MMLDDPLELFMVTPSYTGVLYNGQSTTYLVYFDSMTNQITKFAESDYLKPGAYISNKDNIIGAPMLVFVRHDVPSNQAWLQITPEPLFPNHVLWTVPTGVNFSESFAFSTETSPQNHDINNFVFDEGIIYYQTANQIAAVNMHEGDFRWSIPLPVTSYPHYSPIISTKVGTYPMTTRYFLYVFTKDYNANQVAITSIGCCSGNGVCANTDPPIGCACNTNYYGDTCNAFCNTAVCSSCSGTGVCTCPIDTYGPLCNSFCNSAITCNGRGVCNSNGTCSCPTSAALQFSLFSGTNCEIQETNWFFIGCIIAAGLVVLLGIILGVLSFTRKDSEKRTRKKNKYDLINN
jgi:hypothetical protein